jgi:hypothetical protein
MMHMPVGEFAAMMQMQMLFPNTPLTLMPNESWKLLLLMHEMFMAQVAVQPPRQSSYPLTRCAKTRPLPERSKLVGVARHPRG